MRKSAKLFGLAVAAGALLASGATTTASAEPTFNVGVTTDYIFRGIDQTTSWSEGAAFAGVDIAPGQFYAGAWVSNTGSHSAQFFEYDIYGGWKPTLGPVTLDLGFIYYGYTDTNDTVADESELSTPELKVGATIAPGGVSLTGNIYWTPNFSGDADGLDDNQGFYYEALAAYTFANSATLSGGLGFADVEDYVIESYMTWNVGVTYPITEAFGIDVRYIGSDDDATAGFGGNGDTVVGTLKLTF